MGPSIGDAYKDPSPLWLALVDCIGNFSKNDYNRMSVTATASIIEPLALGVGGFFLAKHSWRFTALKVKPFIQQVFRT